MERFIIGYLILAGISFISCAVFIAQDGGSALMVFLGVALGIACIVIGVLQAIDINRRNPALPGRNKE